MQKLTIKAYAVKYKLSMFNVMKMLKSEQVKSEVIDENGKEVTYIVADDELPLKNEKSIVLDRQESSLKNEIQRLSEEVQILREEIESLKLKV